MSELDTLRTENAQLRADLQAVNGVLTDLYNELGCKHDNEAGLLAVHQLRAKLTQARDDRDQAWSEMEEQRQKLINAGYTNELPDITPITLDEQVTRVIADLAASRRDYDQQKSYVVKLENDAATLRQKLAETERERDAAKEDSKIAWGNIAECEKKLSAAGYHNGSDPTPITLDEQVNAVLAERDALKQTVAERDAAIKKREDALQEIRDRAEHSITSPDIDEDTENELSDYIDICDEAMKDEASPANVATAAVDARRKSCGCVLCMCEGDRCCGCGAKHCGTHPVGEFGANVPASEQADAAREWAGRLQDEMERQARLVEGHKVHEAGLKSQLHAAQARIDTLKSLLGDCIRWVPVTHESETTRRAIQRLLKEIGEALSDAERANAKEEKLYNGFWDKQCNRQEILREELVDSIMKAHGDDNEAQGEAMDKLDELAGYAGAAELIDGKMVPTRPLKRAEAAQEGGNSDGR